jgi:tmRNA-binding protein
METFNFNHDNETIINALGVTEEIDMKCREIIFFSMISNHFMARELFDNVEDAPKALTTMTGDLEKCMKLCSNHIESSYILLTFKDFHRMGMDAIAKYTIFTESKDERRKEIELMLKIFELDIMKQASKHDSDCMIPTDIFKKIDFVKKSRYSFDRYLQLCNGESEVDNILNNIFKDGESTN